MIYIGDCLAVLPTLDANSIDSIVTDPPYGLGFMGKAWDHAVPGEPFWREMLRVAKPGAYLVAFGGTRTFHRMACAIEDAGWELRDTLMWVYGSGFPKSLDVSKAIDKFRDWSKIERLNGEISRARAAAGLSLKQIGDVMQTATNGRYGAWYHRGGHMFFETGRNLPSRPEWDCLRAVLPIAAEFQTAYEEAERAVLSERTVKRDGGSWAEHIDGGMFQTGERTLKTTAPATDAASQWQGWGTALKPAWEPIILARKPLIGTVAANVLAHGTGGLNIDGCRIETAEHLGGGAYAPEGNRTTSQSLSPTGMNRPGATAGEFVQPVGRWPANLVHDGSDEVVAMFPSARAAGYATPPQERTKSTAKGNCYGEYGPRAGDGYNDIGSAARFFYCAKADREDRNDGLYGHVYVTISREEQNGDEQWENVDQVARLRVDTARSQLRVIDGSGIAARNATEWSMSLFGNPPMVQSQQGSTSTTATASRSTTPSAILNCYRSWLTSESTADANCGLTDGGSLAVTAANGTTSITTTSERMASVLGVEVAASRTRFKISVNAAPSDHPTVKPTDLMRWLCRLVTPPGGTVLDPFTGSGSTWRAAVAEGMDFVGIELDPAYAEIAQARMRVVQPGFSFK